MKTKKKVTETQKKVTLEVCQKLKTGKSLEQIFYFRSGEHLPALVTFRQWMKDEPEINEAVTQAKLL